MIEIGLTVTLLILGFFIGGEVEKRHYRNLRERENQLLTKLPARTDRGPTLQGGNPVLVACSVVVASDYFKNFVGSLRNIFGGRLSTHETLLDRARREALCRLREKCIALGASQVVDVHMTTSFLDQMGVEVMAYGTAIRA